MKWKKFIKIKENLSGILYSLLAIIFALIMGAFLIYISGYSVYEAYYQLFFGAFGNIFNLAQTLLKTTPLIFTGLAVAIAFRSGLFNIGVEGQMYWGAFVSAIICVSFSSLSGFLLIPLALIGGAAAGGLWGSIPGLLKAKTGAHEVITTIMLNYIATLGTTFLLTQYFKAGGPVDQTEMIPDSAKMTPILENTRLSWAIFLGIAIIILIKFLFDSTSLGYDLKIIGKNSPAAEYSGVPVNQMTVLSMAISGAVGGLAGSTMVMGVLHRFITNFSPGYGFTGIAVAVLGRNKPWGVLAGALLFGALEAGGMSMQLFAKIPSDLMTVVQGLVILFVAAPALIKFISGILTGKGIGGSHE